MADGADAVRDADTAADRIVFLGHATVLIELDGMRLLLDPLLRGRVLHLRRQVPPVDESMCAGPDAVLISHLHHDHLDLPSLRRLGSDMRLIVPSGAGVWLASKGFANVSEMDVGDVMKVGELEITAISIHAYPYVADKYALTSCGSSMGDNYGPMVVAMQPMLCASMTIGGGVRRMVSSRTLAQAVHSGTIQSC